jgi:energy-coupling factor transporter ATP-binding protein EcfA2
MKLTRLKLHRFRDVAPGTELVFSPAFNLLLGDNGTGRTTLLELIAQVLGADFSTLAREEFALDYSLVLPGMEIHISVHNTKDAGTPAAPATSPGEASLLSLRPLGEAREFAPSFELVLVLTDPAARLVMRADASRVAWEVDGKTVDSVSMGGWALLQRSVWTVFLMTVHRLEPEVGERLKELRSRVFLMAPSRFAEGLELFERLGTLRYALELRDGMLFPLGLMALPTWLSGLIRERVAKEPPADALELHHTEAPERFLARFVALAGFAAGTLRMEVMDPELRASGRVEFGRLGFRFTRQDGSVLSHAELGYGQKRLLSFLYALDVNEDFLVADELANGLHPEKVEACLRGLGGRQAFLTSQNPLVFEHVPLGSAEEARRSLILCATGLHAGRQQVLWSNPAPETAGRLQEAWRRGTAPLAEVLRSQGLW